MNMEHWCSAMDEGKPQYSEKSLFQCHFDYQKSHREWHGIKPGPPRINMCLFITVSNYISGVSVFLEYTLRRRTTHPVHKCLVASPVITVRCFVGPPI
jgi:hypothetical protein